MKRPDFTTLPIGTVVKDYCGRNVEIIDVRDGCVRIRAERSGDTYWSAADGRIVRYSLGLSEPPPIESRTTSEHGVCVNLDPDSVPQWATANGGRQDEKRASVFEEWQ
jgi:hypothetical protein